ncbi:MAG TPA: hypothetical protein VGO47_13665 [Chlamydiales bacterium]|jgi:hypothetical protein|nr:hypothetical protein [Chlamydiales bacterium]
MHIFFFSHILLSLNAKSIKRDTLIRYLLDELYNYEENHADALRPIQQERDVSFLSEHTAIQPVTAHGVAQILQTHMEQLADQLEERFSVIVEGMQNHVSQIKSTVGFSIPTGVERRGHHNPLPSQCASKSELNSACIEIADNATDDMDTEELPISLRMRVLPRAKKGKISTAWKLIIQDWNKASPPENPVALKDWKRGWYSGKNRTRYGVMYHQRCTIVEEYEK